MLTSGENVMDISQSDRTKSGKQFEKFVFDYIDKTCLSKHNISVFSGSDIQSVRPDIYQKIRLSPACGGFIGDVDILLFDEDIKSPLLIISTKTSIRERLYQVLCTKYMYSGIYPNIQVWFVTKDISNELNYTRQPFKLATYFNIPCYVSRTDGYFGGVVKPLSDLNSDLKHIYCKC